MRRSALAGLVLLCSSCASGSAPAPAPQPGVAPPRVGVLVPVGRQKCPRVVIGPVVRRVCLPGRGAQPADTTARDTTRTDAPATRSTAAGGR